MEGSRAVLQLEYWEVVVFFSLSVGLIDKRSR